MKSVNIKPLKPSKAVNHPDYADRLRQAAAHFLSRVPDELGGRKIVSLLSFGSADDLKRAGIRLWDNVPDARDAATRIDALARHMLAVEGYAAAKAQPCPLETAIKEAGINMPPDHVLDAIREAAGIQPDSEVELIVEDGLPEECLKDDDHGLPPACFFALQRVLPGIRVVRGKVISCPTMPVNLAQAILDLTLQKAEKQGLN